MSNAKMSKAIYTNMTLDFTNCDVILTNCRITMDKCKVKGDLVRDEFYKILWEYQCFESQLEESHKTINELEVKIIDKDWYINHLQSELEECSKSRDDALFDSDVKDDEIKRLRGRKAVHRRKNAVLNKKNGWLRDKNAKLRDENDKLLEEIAKLREENAKLREENDKLKSSDLTTDQSSETLGSVDSEENAKPSENGEGTF